MEVKNNGFIRWLIFSSDDAGSDSSADDGLPLHLERFAKPKKKKVKAKKITNQAPKPKEQVIF